MSDVLTLLRTARALIADPAHWTRGFDARDADGLITHAVSRQAVSWCAVGSLRAATARLALADDVCQDAVGALVRALEGLSPVWVNDTIGHDAVLGGFSKAIALMEGETCPTS